MEDLQNAWGNLHLERFSPRAFERGLWGLLKRGKDKKRERAIEERKKKKAAHILHQYLLRAFCQPWTTWNTRIRARGTFMTA